MKLIVERSVASLAEKFEEGVEVTYYGHDTWGHKVLGATPEEAFRNLLIASEGI